MESRSTRKVRQSLEVLRAATVTRDPRPQHIAVTKISFDNDVLILKQKLLRLPKNPQTAPTPRALPRMTMRVVCGIIGARVVWQFSDSSPGLFQISVKLPHEPHKIQVMVRAIS
jgi:hypothetical protein